MKVEDMYELIGGMQGVAIELADGAYGNDELWSGEWRYYGGDYDEREVLSVYATYHGELVLTVGTEE